VLERSTSSFEHWTSEKIAALASAGHFIVRTIAKPPTHEEANLASRLFIQSSSRGEPFQETAPTLCARLREAHTDAGRKNRTGFRKERNQHFFPVMRMRRFFSFFLSFARRRTDFLRFFPDVVFFFVAMLFSFFSCRPAFLTKNSSLLFFFASGIQVLRRLA
jgi:hypothetical protein